MPTDWLVPLDDGLCQRQQHCTLCGRTDIQGWFDICDIGGLSLATLVCVPCRAHAPDQSRLLALLAARYRPQGEGEDG